MFRFVISPSIVNHHVLDGPHLTLSTAMDGAKRNQKRKAPLAGVITAILLSAAIWFGLAVLVF